MRPSSFRQILVGAALAATLGLGGGAVALAQDTAADTGQPAHIHVGTCAELDPNPVAPLHNLLPAGVERNDDGTVNEDAEMPEALGVLTTGPVTTSNTDDVEFAWEDMLATSHAIAVHESEANIQNYVACGDIGGVVFDDEGNKMIVGLHPVGDSGFTGIAILSEDGDGNVDVEVIVTGAPATGDADVSATPEG